MTESVIFYVISSVKMKFQTNTSEHVGRLCVTDCCDAHCGHRGCGVDAFFSGLWCA